jgi:hypothetical protein
LGSNSVSDIIENTEYLIGKRKEMPSQRERWTPQKPKRIIEERLKIENKKNIHGKMPFD